MKVSFVATVLNEEENILKLLDSLEIQTKKPDEVIIVDGGSKDSTVKLVKSFASESLLNYRILEEKSNRARGRNLGIGRASGEVVAVSDAGCVLSKHWLERITKPLIEGKVDAVAGFYRMKKNTIFTHCSAPFFGPMSHNIDRKTFLPSSRSIAFTKAAWKKVHGYPTSVHSAAEDSVFAQLLFDDPVIKMVTHTSALVEWSQPDNFKKFFTDIGKHVKGDLEAGYSPHLKKNALVAIRYALAVPLILATVISGSQTMAVITWFLVVIYLIYPSLKFIRLVSHPLHPVYFAALQITADVAVLTALLTPK